MVREYLKSVLHEIEEQRKANTAEIEEQRLEKETIDNFKNLFDNIIKNMEE